MNDTMSEEEIRNALDLIARNFQPSRRPAFTVLIPFKGQIRYYTAHVSDTPFPVIIELQRGIAAVGSNRFGRAGLEAGV